MRRSSRPPSMRPGRRRRWRRAPTPRRGAARTAPGEALLLVQRAEAAAGLHPAERRVRRVGTASARAIVAERPDPDGEPAVAAAVDGAGRVVATTLRRQ